MPQKQQQPTTVYTIDSKARFGPVSGPLAGGVAALALSAVIWAVNTVSPVHGIPVWMPLAIAVFGCVVTAVIPLFKPIRSADLVFRMGCWMTAGMWSFLSLTIARHNFLMMCIILVPLVAAAMIVAKAMFEPVEAKPGEPGLPLASYASTPLGLQDAWAVILQQHSTRFMGLKEHEPLTVARVDSWPNNSGATFQFNFAPGSPRGIDDVARITTMLQQAVQLPDGCVMTPNRSGKQGVVLLDVMFFNDMATRYDFPTDWHARSGRDDLPIAIHGDKTYSTINIYQNSALIIGIRGGGKTILLQNITAWLMQCVDVVVWIVDLNGGALAMPWTYSTAIGEIDGYPIDWVAHTPDIALKMGQASVRIAKARKSKYARLLMQKNTDKLPITDKVPMLMVLVDEGAELTGETASRIAMEATEAFQEAQRIGRAMCVNIIFCGQRATSDYIPAQAKKLAAIKIALRVDDDAELAQLFGWKKLLYTCEDLMHDGSMLVRPKVGGEIRLAKGLFIEQQTIRECAKATIRIRPALDQVSADAAGFDYRNRWDDPETVEWLEAMSSTSFDDLGGLVDDETGLMREPGERPAAVAVMDRPEPAQPTTGGGHGGDGDRPAGPVSLAELMRLDRDMNRMSADLGLGDQPAGPATPPPGQGGDNAGGGKHDKDRIIDDRVDSLDAVATLQALMNMPTRDPRESNQPPVEPPPAADTKPAPEDPAPGKVVGRDWVLQTLREHGGLMRSGEILTLAKTAGVTDRAGSISEWLGQLTTAGLVESPEYAKYRAVRKG